MADPGAMTDLAFHLLVALVDEPLHGYALVKRLRALEGRGGLRTGTVYAALARLQDEGWVEDASHAADADGDGRRRTYRVTPAGREAARREAARLAAAVERARAKDLLDGRAGA